MAHKGVNLGGWLMMEGYILHGRNIPEHAFKKAFLRAHGSSGLKEFERRYRSTFISSADFKNIAAMGADTVRLPFNARLIETGPNRYSDEGLALLVTALDWAHRYGLSVILDMHAACQPQNADWHSDSAGKAALWADGKARTRSLRLWECIADRVRNHPALLGYDVLNEPVLPDANLALLKTYYRDAVRCLRAIDPRSLIYLEGNTWAQRIDFLADLLDDRVALSIHTYQPLTYTFNFTPFQTFPGTCDGEKWSRTRLLRYLEPYARFARRHKTRIYVGEFGINWRGGHFGEAGWLDGILDAFDRYDFDYTYWTYKSVAQNVFPDGLYQYLPNEPFIRREGPVYGWENYAPLWKTERERIVRAWGTEQYTPNRALISVLKRHFTA